MRMGIDYFQHVRIYACPRVKRDWFTVICGLFLCFSTHILHAKAQGADFIGKTEEVPPTPEIVSAPEIICKITEHSHPYDTERGCFVIPEGDKFLVKSVIKTSPQTPTALSYETNFPEAKFSVDGQRVLPLQPLNSKNLIFSFKLLTSSETEFVWVAKDSSSTDNLVDLRVPDGYNGTINGCSLSLCVEGRNTTEPPTCNLRITSPLPLQCAGNGVEINISASGSSTNVPGRLNYNYATTCLNAEIVDGATSSEAMLSSDATLFISPSKGEQCAVTATVTDLLNQKSTCAVSLAAPNCDLSDRCTSELDSCGVCGGDGSSCLTCETIDVTSIQMSSELHLRSAADRLRSFFSKTEERYRARNMLRSHLAGMLENKVNRLNTREAAAIQVLWTPPSLISLCAGPQINTCSVERYDETVELFRQKIDKIRQFSLNNSRKFNKRRVRDLLRERGLTFEKARRQSIERAIRLRRAVRADLKKARDTFNGLPVENFSCEGLSS